LAYCYLHKDSTEYTDTNIFKYTRPEFFFIVTKAFVNYFTTGKTKSTYLFNLVNDYEVIGSFPVEAFVPWKIQYDKLRCVLDDEFLLFKVRAKETVKDMNFIQRGDKEVFDFFLNTIFRRMGSRFLVDLEHMAPGCTIPIIMRGKYNTLSTMQSVRFEDILEMYHDFVTSERFEHSQFRSLAAESRFRREEGSVDDMEYVKYTRFLSDNPGGSWNDFYQHLIKKDDENE